MDHHVTVGCIVSRGLEAAAFAAILVQGVLLADDRVPPAPGQGQERTSFQTAAKWDPMLQLPADVAMCYGVGPDIGERIRQWKDRGYLIHVMTGVAWGNYQDYLYGKFDGKRHVDEAQTDKNGNVISHGGDVYYMCPGPTFGNYLAERVRAAIQAGAEAIHLEEPEFWARAGYSEGFKRAWKTAYGEDWVAPHSSPDAQYKSSKLKYDLYRQALKQVFDAVRADGAKSGRRVPCYVATHSLINYAQWGIVSPESSLLSVGADGFIAQVWTGTARTPNLYEGRLSERTFETAFLEYGAMVATTRGSEGRLWLLHDPVEDDRNHSWSDYRTNWQCTVVASLLWPEVSRYEVSPWPERVFHGRYPVEDRSQRRPSERARREPISPAYASELLVVMNALNDMEQEDLTWECGTRGIGIVVSDSMMFQRVEPEPSDPHLSSFYGLALPLLMRGIPVEPVQLEAVNRQGGLDRYRVLLMTYEGMKPMSPDVHDAISGWVKSGGVLVFVDADNDPYNHVKSWWNPTGPQADRIPREALFTTLGIEGKPTAGLRQVGKGAVFHDASSPAALARDARGAEVVRSLVREACKKSGLEYRESSRIVLRRGPYVIAAGLENSEANPIDELEGRFVNLFSSELPVDRSVRLEPGRRFLLYDLEKEPAKDRRVVAAACRVLGEIPRGDGGLEFTAVGPDRTEAVIRLRLARPPQRVSVDGEALGVNAQTWDPDSQTLRVRFPNKPDGRKVVVE